MPDRIEVKIYYEDTDCGGVVYYANYLRYLERARTEYLEKRGLLLKDLKAEGFQFVVRRVEIEYLAPGSYGDVLAVETNSVRTEGLKIIFDNTITDAASGKILAKALTTLICIDSRFRPVRIPAFVKERL